MESHTVQSFCIICTISISLTTLHRAHCALYTVQHYPSASYTVLVRLPHLSHLPHCQRLQPITTQHSSSSSSSCSRSQRGPLHHSCAMAIKNGWVRKSQPTRVSVPTSTYHLVTCLVGTESVVLVDQTTDGSIRFITIPATATDVTEISHSSWPWHRSDATALAGFTNMMITMMNAVYTAVMASLKHSMCIRKATWWLHVSDIKDLSQNAAENVTQRFPY